jgi:phosphatidylglycerol:prolipoprotein diacylglycerol transferase
MSFELQPVTTPVPQSGYWVHDLSPFVVRFPEGFWLEGVRWYGVAYVLGFVVAAVLLRLYFKRGRSPLDTEQQSILMTALLFGVILGGRLGYVLLYMPLWQVLDDPLEIIRVHKGGMASHGGMVGVWLALLWFSWKHKLRFWRLMDIVVTLAPAGFFFGRVANFINGELWGRETSVAWAIVFRYSRRGVEEFLLPRHPSQLYAAVLEGLLMLAWTQWRFWRWRLPEGQVVAEAMMLYGLVRIVDEFFRQPDAGISLILGLSRGQFYSVLLLLFGACAFMLARRRGQSFES